MKLPSDGRYRVLADHLLSPNESSSTETGLHSIELLAKGIPWESKITQAIAKTMSCPSQMYSEIPLLKITLTHLTELEEIELAST